MIPLALITIALLTALALWWSHRRERQYSRGARVLNLKYPHDRAGCTSTRSTPTRTADNMHKINIIFDDSPYVRSHMKQPRGRGSWTFADRPNGDVMKAKFSPGDMSLSEAKRWVRKWVEHHNRDNVDPPSTLVLYVLP